MDVIKGKCGTDCSTCGFKEKFNCNGCVEQKGKIFWGECDIYKCASEKGYAHCGECPALPYENRDECAAPPCAKLIEFIENGHNPNRLSNLKAWRDAVIDTRCGLHCTGCAFIESHNCKGCIATNGHPFHGECPVAACCQEKGFLHCGECPDIPCAQLAEYSCDPVHGDTPPGTRIEQCRKWKNTTL